MGNPSAEGYLDYIEILGTKKLIAHDKQFSFRNSNASNENAVYEFNIKNASNIYNVWDISDHLNPMNVVNQSTSNDFTFKSYGGNDKNYITVHPTDYLIPEAIQNNFVENIRFVKTN